MKRISIPVPKKFFIPGLKQINDSKLEKTISSMIYKLFDNNEKAASKIVFGIFKGMLPVGGLMMDLVNHFIFINAEVKEMLKNEDGKEIVYAVLAHEIGHIVDTRKNNYCYEEPLKNYSCDYSLEQRLKYEVQADEIALVLLREIYSNPKEILFKQICFVMDNMLAYKNIKPASLDLAKMIFEARKNAIAC